MKRYYGQPETTAERERCKQLGRECADLRANPEYFNNRELTEAGAHVLKGLIERPDFGKTYSYLVELAGDKVLKDERGREFGFLLRQYRNYWSFTLDSKD